MCGIAGFIDCNQNSSAEILDAMVGVLQHRGPDDKGSQLIEWGDAQVGLGHTRLAILDLSAAGHQPMRYRNWIIVFNGEIYNFYKIKNELIEYGHEFVTKTDTEVILHAFEKWGVDAVNHFIGMFVFVIIDQKEQLLYIFRDRAGVKPIYYYWENGLFLFGSELKSFHRHPSFKKVLDESSLALYFDFGYVPAPYSIFKDTYKLKPAYFLTFDINKRKYILNKYWDVNSFYKKDKLKISYQDAKLI